MTETEYLFLKGQRGFRVSYCTPLLIENGKKLLKENKSSSWYMKK